MAIESFKRAILSLVCRSTTGPPGKTFKLKVLTRLKNTILRLHCPPLYFIHIQNGLQIREVIFLDISQLFP